MVGTSGNCGDLHALLKAEPTSESDQISQGYIHSSLERLVIFQMKVTVCGDVVKKLKTGKENTSVY